MTGEKTAPTQPIPSKPPAFEQQGFTDRDVIDFTPALKAQALEVLQSFDHGPLFTPPTERGAVQAPGNVGGANWGGAAFDPETNRLFVPSLNNPIIVQLVKPEAGRGNIQYRGRTPNLPTLDGLKLWKPPYSSVTAYDLNSGRLAWRTPTGDGPRNHPLLKDLNLGPLGSGTRGGPLVTKTLLFVTELSGGLGGGEALPVGGRPLTTMSLDPPRIRAFDKATGERVWEKEVPLRPAASPMTYLYQGRQYLVVAVGGGVEARLVAFALPMS